MKKNGPYHVIDFPPERRAVLSFIDVHWRKHCMYGLLEVDVTVARQFIEEYKARTGEQLSFTGYLAFCLARAVDENKEGIPTPRGNAPQCRVASAMRLSLPGRYHVSWRHHTSRRLK